MKQEKKDKHFIGKPYYEGGITALRAFISQHLQYPAEALQARVEGTVMVNYTINYKGKVIDAKVVAGLGYGCDEEALRLARLLEFKVPKVRGVKVKFHKNIQIHFRLPPVQPGPTYQFKPKTTSEATEKKPAQSSYNYTINYTYKPK
ncbi:MAG: energy transducer TonB [Bacteroidota bacterium]